MTDKPSHHEPDDELLSAYLDGELPADERAAVEARLEKDPAAQKLLHELRSVSQSVQAMPTESLGRDLSEEIIRRAREAAPTTGKAAATKDAPESDSARFIESMPKVRVFSSRRAWIWASMALAAGLLIMIVQRGDEPAKSLPPVAARDRQQAQNEPADEAGQAARREISMSPAPQPAAPPAPPAGAVVSDGEAKFKLGAPAEATPAAQVGGGGAGDQLSAGNAEGPGANRNRPAAISSSIGRKEETSAGAKTVDAPSAPSALPSQIATDKSVPSFQPARSVGGSGPGGPPAMAAEKQKSSSAAGTSAPWIAVVHVVVRPDALQDGSIDRLLANNKIAFVVEPAKSRTFTFGGGQVTKSAPSDGASNTQLDDVAKVQASPTGAVLVEAPAAAIEACLADLNKNSNDFLSIAVNEAPQSQDRFDSKSTLNKKLAESSPNLGRFSRGTAPIAQKDSADLRRYLYSYNLAKPGEPAINGSPRGGLAGQADTVSGLNHDANGNKALSDNDQPLPGIRRARTIKLSTNETRQPGESASAGVRSLTKTETATPKQPASQRTPEEPAETEADKDNNLKVLFVFTPAETPAPNTKADNRPK